MDPENSLKHFSKELSEIPPININAQSKMVKLIHESYRVDLARTLSKCIMSGTVFNLKIAKIITRFPVTSVTKNVNNLVMSIW